ncbi:expressed unknown protein [Seminavis robusta]|uniref:Uncharacterized protein n=1 Tax=Seminavis robusta TaxID=568900 RepID=A0A9N8DSM7_9STRA|nr:expressed unknown protein [Seminavis robusta]|eukprot:Sro250_g098920.1 n/a (123) ;mRNA; r:14626-14994
MPSRSKEDNDSWDQFRKESSMFIDDKKKKKVKRAASTGGGVKRHNSNGSVTIKKALSDAIWTRTKTNDGKSRRNSSPADIQKTRQKLQNAQVGKILDQKKADGARLGRVSRRGKFVTASIAA